MDRYSIALGKKPPPPPVIPESAKIYYMGVCIDNQHWAAAICREKSNATIEIVDTSTLKRYRTAEELAQNLNHLNKKYPIRFSLIDSLSQPSEALTFKASCKSIKDDIKNEINEFYEFWMNVPDVNRLSAYAGFIPPMDTAIKLSFWALHESLTKETPDLYTNKNSFNRHVKKLQRLSGINAPPRNDEIDFSEVENISPYPSWGIVTSREPQGFTSIQGLPTIPQGLWQ